MIWGVLEHVVGVVALCAARIAPLAFLCPVLGGPRVPSHVKLALVLSIASLVCVAGSTRWAIPPVPSVAFAFSIGIETCRGVVLGLIANAPFVAARMAGRWIDASRGASAESALPFLGSTDAASGDLLHQLLIGAVCATQGLSPFLAGLWASFGTTAPGAPFLPSIDGAVEFTCDATALALAIAAPAIVACLTMDAVSGIVHRVCPELNATSHANPVRILVGAAVLVLTLPGGVGRLLDFVARSGSSLAGLEHAP